MLDSFSSQLYEEMELSLELINGSLKFDSEKYRDALTCVNYFVQRLEYFVVENAFADEQQEIEFFKFIYPRFQSWFIYYAELWPILKNVPGNAPDVIVRDYYLQEFNYLRRFFDQNRVVYDYYLEGLDDRDETYFLARNYARLLPLVVELPMDKRFLTNQGYNFAKFIAYGRLQEFVGRRLRLLYRNPDGEYVEQLLKTGRRKWTGEKIELIEIAYGIYYTRRMNSGKAEVKDIVEWLEDTLSVDLGDAYRMFLDLRRRKGKSYTKYLEEMIAAIRSSIEEGNRFSIKKDRNSSANFL